VERVQAQANKSTGHIEELDNTIKNIQQALTEIQAQLQVLEKKQVETPPSSPPQTVLDNETLFKQAQDALRAGKHSEARQLLRQFLSRDTNDPRAPYAQQMLGDSYYAEEKIAPAIQEYRKITEHFKDSDVFPDALFKIGMSFYQLKFCSDAAGYLEELIKKYPKHKESKRSRKIIKLIRNHKKDRAFCSS
ncbi:MAG: tetratricopeptide repeat protein, partial [Pseudomonadota bacterium]